MPLICNTNGPSNVFSPFKSSFLNVKLNRECSRSATQRLLCGRLARPAPQLVAVLTRLLADSWSGPRSTTASRAGDGRALPRPAGRVLECPRSATTTPQSPPPPKKAKCVQISRARLAFVSTTVVTCYVYTKQLPALQDGATIQTINKLQPT